VALFFILTVMFSYLMSIWKNNICHIVRWKAHSSISCSINCEIYLKLICGRELHSSVLLCSK